MKVQLALALSLLVACKKSDSAKPDDPPPTATERPGSDGSAHIGDRGMRMLKDLDTNHDGVISDEERAAGRRKRIETMRAKLDTNGDGKLTPDELKAGVGRMKFENPTVIDTNKDGDISVEELEVAVKARRDAHRAPTADEGSAAE